MATVSKAIILAAGRGQRMRHLTEHLPKPLLKVGGKTFLDIIFDALSKEIEEVMVVVGYQGDKIRDYLGANYRGRTVRYIDWSPSGTGHSIMLAKSFFKARERFLIFYSDELITGEEVASCLAHDLSWLCWTVEDPRAAGIVSVSSGGFITEIVEKPQQPKSNLGGGGLMLVNSNLFNYQPDKNAITGEYHLSSMMNKFAKDHKIRAVIGKQRPSFSVPEDIARFADYG